MRWLDIPLDGEAAALSREHLPGHVAIIMDGNGRWASSKGRPRTFGHRAGMESLRTVIKLSARLGIKALTVYTFSTENWKRPATEVGFLMDLVVEYFRRDMDELIENDTRLMHIGDLSPLPEAARKAILSGEERSADCPGMIFNIALNYGGRDEILHAVNTLIASGKKGPVSREDFEACMYTSALPDPDLIIRTGGELRLSNFLLYQAAYSELYFTKTLWPDFGENEYIEALREFAGRKRRFGDVK